MKTFNKKTIILFSMSALIFTGCTTTNEPKLEPPVKTKSIKTQNSWGKVASSKVKNEDCIDCYASPVSDSKIPVVENTMFTQVLEEPSKTVVYQQTKVASTKRYGNYAYEDKASDVKTKTESYANPNVTSFSVGTTAIQVGAFKEYSGAKIYLKRYKALSDRYTVTIKTGKKNNKPLYRVRIEGFKNKVEAKKFMESYGLSNAFLVRK